MTRTGRGQEPREGRTAVILVDSQMGENIGAAARAMYNFGLTDLRLVRPRDGWPNPAATAMAAGADRVLDAVTLFASVAEAVADLHFVAATSARPRHMVKPVRTPAEAAARVHAQEQAGARCGILFGAERSGLDNDTVALAQEVIRIPVNPAFPSLNLGQAVLVVAYELFLAAHGEGETPPPLDYLGSEPATAADLDGLIGHLTRDLEAAGYFYPPEKKEVMARTIRNIFQRSVWSGQEVQILRGVVKALGRGRPPRQ